MEFSGFWWNLFRIWIFGTNFYKRFPPRPAFIICFCNLRNLPSKTNRSLGSHKEMREEKLPHNKTHEPQNNKFQLPSFTCTFSWVFFLLSYGFVYRHKKFQWFNYALLSTITPYVKLSPKINYETRTADFYLCILVAKDIYNMNFVHLSVSICRLTYISIRALKHH